VSILFVSTPEIPTSESVGNIQVCISINIYVSVGVGIGQVRPDFDRPELSLLKNLQA